MNLGVGNSMIPHTTLRPFAPLRVTSVHEVRNFIIDSPPVSGYGTRLALGMTRGVREMVKAGNDKIRIY